MLELGGAIPDTTYVGLHRTLLTVLPRADTRYRLTRYRQCCTGRAAVTAVRDHYALATRAEALALLQRLRRDYDLLDHVTHDHDVTDDDKYFYRLHPFHESPNVLNSLRRWRDRVDPDSVGLVLRLQHRLGRVVSRHTNDATGKVDYTAVQADPDFLDFEEASCELRGVDLATMPDENTKLAFGLNLYNLMIKHAFVKVGVPDGAASRNTFFAKVGYRLRGALLSFNDLEHGVLRSNARPPYALRRQFHGHDPRLSWIRTLPVDGRIHFALNCGAASCPPINTFHAESINEELRIVAASFTESDDNVAVDDVRHTLTLTKILDWYGKDFAPSKADLPNAIVGLLRGDKRARLQRMLDTGKSIAVDFYAYDWSTNASSSKTYGNNDSLK